MQIETSARDLDIFKYAKVQTERKQHAQPILEYLKQAAHNLPYRELYIGNWIRRGYNYLNRIPSDTPETKELFDLVRNSIMGIETRLTQQDYKEYFTSASESVRRLIQNRQLLYGIAKDEGYKPFETIVLPHNATDFSLQKPFYLSLVSSPNVEVNPEDHRSRFLMESSVWEAYFISKKFPESVPKWGTLSSHQSRVLERYNFEYLPFPPVSES